MNDILNHAGPKALSMLHFNIRTLLKNLSLLDDIDMLYSLEKSQLSQSTCNSKLYNQYRPPQL